MTTARQFTVSKTVPFLLMGGFIVALGFVFRDTLGAMLQSWQQQEYSHGYLIPPLALVLLLNKAEVSKVSPQASWAGALIVVLGINAQFIFQWAGVYGLLPQIFLITLIGTLILFWGRHLAWALAAPLTLLFFCAPLPKLLFYTLSFDMQMLSSSLGAALLTLLNIPVFQDGNAIDLGGYQLQVAEACSGLRYLFPLMGLSFLLAILYQAALWKRALIFISAIPISVMMNGLRIALIGITVDQWGLAMAEGLLHELEGLVIFAGCTVLLFVEIALLQKIGGKGALRFDYLRMPSFKYLPAPRIGRPTLLCGVFLVGALAASVALPAFISGHMKPVPLAQPFSAFPLQLGPWVGHQSTLDAHSLSVLGTNDYLVADYVQDGGVPVNLYVLYYPQQDSTSNQAVHSPAICIPAGGWEVVSQGRQEINMAGGAMTVNKMLASKGSVRELVYYWFVQDGHQTASPDQSRLYMLKNALAKGRTNGAMIRVMRPIIENEPEGQAQQKLIEFMNDGLGTLTQYLKRATP